jgi:predicted protein tyrosine phosphatase
MWKWTLNWGQATPSIVIGSCPMTVKDLQQIQAETGVTAMLSLQHDDCLRNWKIDYPTMKHSGIELGMIMARCPIRDFDIEDMRRQLPDAISCLARLLGAGHKVYLHCTAGLGRSPLVTLGYLTLVDNKTPDDAIQTILKARPDAVPAWEAYHGCCNDLLDRYRPVIEQRAYELYQSGIHGNADADWLAAKAEIFRTELTRER